MNFDKKQEVSYVIYKRYDDDLESWFIAPRDDAKNAIKIDGNISGKLLLDGGILVKDMLEDEIKYSFYLCMGEIKTNKAEGSVK